MEPPKGIEPLTYSLHAAEFRLERGGMSEWRTRAVRVQTHIGPAWQAQCSCEWVGERWWTKGAADQARSERWSHELDHEDGRIPNHTDGSVS